MKTISSRERVFAAIFLLALAWGAWTYRHLFLGTQQAETLKDSPAEGGLALSNPQEHPVPESALPGDTSSPELPDWGDDPFNRPWRSPGFSPTAAATHVVKKQALWLTAIVVRPNQRYAVINGKIVKEGQEVAGRQVTRIEASRVLVDDNGVEVTLTL